MRADHALMCADLPLGFRASSWNRNLEPGEPPRNLVVEPDGNRRLQLGTASPTVRNRNLEPIDGTPVEPHVFELVFFPAAGPSSAAPERSISGEGDPPRRGLVVSISGEGPPPYPNPLQ